MFVLSLLLCCYLTHFHCMQMLHLYKRVCLLSPSQVRQNRLLNALMSFCWNQTLVLKGLSTDDCNPQKSIAAYHRGILSSVTLIWLLRASSAIDLGWNSTGRMYGSLIANDPIVMFLLSTSSCRNGKLGFLHPRGLV